MLFNPDIDAKAEHDIGVQNLVANAVTECDVDLWYRLYKYIVVVGGGSLFDGISRRLQVESTTRMIDAHA